MPPMKKTFTCVFTDPTLVGGQIKVYVVTIIKTRGPEADMNKAKQLFLEHFQESQGVESPTWEEFKKTENYTGDPVVKTLFTVEPEDSVKLVTSIEV